MKLNDALEIAKMVARSESATAGWERKRDGFCHATKCKIIKCPELKTESEPGKRKKYWCLHVNKIVQKMEVNECKWTAKKENL